MLRIVFGIIRFLYFVENKALPFVLPDLIPKSINSFQTICAHQSYVKEIDIKLIKSGKRQRICRILDQFSSSIKEIQYETTCKRMEVSDFNWENCSTEYKFTGTVMHHSDHMGTFVMTYANGIKIKSFHPREHDKTNIDEKHNWNNESKEERIDRSFSYFWISFHQGFCNESADRYIFGRSRPVVIFQTNIPIVIKTERERPAKIEFKVESYQTPVVLWSHTSGGKLSTWATKKLNDSKSFKIFSTITPLNHSHFGNYSVRIRNSEGSEEVTFCLAYEESHVEALPKSAVYQTYQTIEIKCTINPKRYINWAFSLKHYWNGNYIRTLAHEVTGNSTKISIPYCDYSDTGQYRCSLYTSEAIFEANSIVLVTGPPIITSKNVSLSNGRLMLSVFAYSFPRSDFSVNWLHEIDGKAKRIDLEAFNVTEHITDTIVALFSYGIPVNADGLVLQIKFRDIQITQGSYVCQISNTYGSKEALFEHAQLDFIVQAINKRLLNDTSSIPFNHSILYICGGAGGCITLIINLTIIVIVWKKKKPARAGMATDETTGENAEQISNIADNFEQNTNSVIYEEILEDSSSFEGSFEEINTANVTHSTERNNENVNNLSCYDDIDDSINYNHKCKQRVNEMCTSDLLNGILHALEDRDMYLVPLSECLELQDFSQRLQEEPVDA